MPRIEERHAFELEGKRLERHRQLAIGEQGLQGRLQEIVQAIFQLDHVLRRANPRDVQFQRAAGGLDLAAERRLGRQARARRFRWARGTRSSARESTRGEWESGSPAARPLAAGPS